MDGDSSPEPDSQPQLIASLAADDSQQRPSIISLGEQTLGLPGLLPVSTQSESSTSYDDYREHNGKAMMSAEAEYQMVNIGSGIVSTNTGSNQYAITEFTEGGFILSTGQDYESEEDESISEVKDGVDDAQYEEESENELLNQAQSEYKSGESRGDSTLSPPTNNGNRRDSNVYISPNLYVSSSSSEDSLSMFDRGGHQGSYVLRKGERLSGPLGDDRQGRGVAVTSISTLNRNEQSALDFGSSGDESAEEFVRGKKHKSLVLKRGKRKRSPLPPDNNTVITNLGAGIGERQEEVAPESNGDSGSDPEDGRIHTVLHHGIRERVKRTLAILEIDSNGSKTNGSCSCAPEKNGPEPPVSAQLQQVKRLGFKMFPLFFFPALPKIIQDIWVAVELFVTFFEFLFACVTFGSGGIINILVVVLTLVNLLLASLDSFLYFVEGGSCVSLYKWGRKKLQKGKSKQLKSDESSKERVGDKDDGTKDSSFSKFRQKVRKVFKTGSEVIRVGLTELLLYPLTILDFYELIDSQTYKVDSVTSRINFGLLIIGLFYLVLTVYVIRILISITAVVSIIRLPKTTNGDYQNLLKKFAAHIILQIVVHMAILVMVATKIDSEQCIETDIVSFDESGYGSRSGYVSGSGSGSGMMSGSVPEGSAGFNETTTKSTNVSPFLYVTIFTGDLIPFLGVIMFFVVNYPALKQFMMGFCIDIMSTIVQEDFASTAFAGEGIKKVNRKASKVVNKVNLASARQEFNVYKNVFSFKKKLSYRLTNPLVMIFTVAYFTLVVVFLTCHVIGWSDPCNSAGSIKFITYSDHQGTFITFIIGLVAIIVANYQVVFMSLIWLIALIGLVLFVVTVPILTLLIAPLLALVVFVNSWI